MESKSDPKSLFYRAFALFPFGRKTGIPFGPSIDPPDQLTGLGEPHSWKRLSSSVNSFTFFCPMQAYL